MKRNINSILLCVVLLSFIILIVGCGKDNGISKSATPYTSSNDQGETIYFTETNPEVVKVKKVVNSFIKASARDYKTITGDECNPYYSRTVLTTYLDNYKAAIVRNYKENQLVEIYIGHDVESISFINANLKCVVMGKLKEKITNKDLNNKTEEGPYSIELVKENDVWKVTR